MYVVQWPRIIIINNPHIYNKRESEIPKRLQKYIAAGS